MTTTVDIGYDGPQACVDCQSQRIATCPHVGFPADSFTASLQQRVLVPGLDPGHDHVLTGVQISADRKRANLTIDTRRPWHRELAAEVSTFWGPKAHVRAFVDGEQVAENRLDAPVQVGETLYLNGDPHTVAQVEYPNRDETGAVRDGSPGARDWQHATLVPAPVEAVTVLLGETP